MALSLFHAADQLCSGQHLVPPQCHDLFFHRFKLFYEGMDAIGKALEYCIKQELYSAGDFRMAVEYFAQTDRPNPEKSAKATVPETYRSLRPQVRSMEEYLQAAEG